jgi:predicted nucleotidyltransferase component of viral defense system
MKDQALAIIQNVANPADKLNLLREYLQAMALRSLHESEAFVNLAFVGGTALRFIHDLPRFSEDLDFSLDNSDGYKPEAWMKKLKNDLQLAGFNATVSWNDRRVVHKAWIKVAGVLKDAGLSAMADQNLSIKLEVDTKPPPGAVSETGIVNRHAMLSLRYYDLPSLMAGKIHALITRKYAKGRDWYDLLWYRAKRPSIVPNLDQLQKALDQTHGQGLFNAENWTSDVVKKLKTLDCESLVNDVKNFLERPEDAALLTEENICSVLK